MNTNPAPRDRAHEAKVMNRVMKEAEAALGGKAMPVMLDDVALFIHYGLDGMLSIGGKIPPHQVPRTLRFMADQLEANARYQAPEAAE